QAQKRHPGPEAKGASAANGPGPDANVEWLADPKLAPDLEAVAKEEIARLLDRLGNAQLRSIAVWKWEGCTNEEIATLLGCTFRTVKHKLWLVRIVWGEGEAS